DGSRDRPGRSAGVAAIGSGCGTDGRPVGLAPAMGARAMAVAPGRVGGTRSGVGRDPPGMAGVTADTAGPVATGAGPAALGRGHWRTGAGGPARRRSYRGAGPLEVHVIPQSAGVNVPGGEDERAGSIDGPLVQGSAAAVDARVVVGIDRDPAVAVLAQRVEHR